MFCVTRQAVSQSKTLLRCNNWVFLPALPGLRYFGHVGTETGNSLWDQLYDLSRDIGQERNLASERPDIVASLRQRLHEIHHQAERT